MAAPRHGRKSVIAWLSGALVAAFVLMGAVVVDRNCGLAIGGFDPVAYFTDQAPLLRHANVVWAFRNVQLTLSP